MMKIMEMKDPRNYQLMMLSSMLIYGLVWLKFDLNILWLALILLTAFVSQWLASKLWKLPSFEWRSAMISGLSLCILMRCPSLPLSLALAALAIFSKFIFRVKNKHIFNPTNLALAVGILATDLVTINPTQWNNGAFLAFFVLGMGMFVSSKACRSDVSLAFLGTYAAGLVIYTAISDQPWSFPLQRLQMASLLIFTFFMISDPKTTPNARWGRLLFGFIVAATGLYIQLVHKIPAGLILSLAGWSVTVPVIDHFFPGTLFQWNSPSEATA